VRDEYFQGTPIDIHTDGGVVGAVIESAGPRDPDRPVVAMVDDAEDARLVETDQIATWSLPEAKIDGDILRTNACDDLAAVSAALEAFDELTRTGAGALPAPVRLLFTLAEEIGFIGAIAACRDGTMPAGSRVIALENSRSFPHDSPIGGGPILRVGDRMSTFDPALTGACAVAAEELAKEDEWFAWQRKLMPGGACEATAYCSYGYNATCLCLPLGNYHNMGNLSEVESGSGDALIEREYISLRDYRGLVRWLVSIGRGDLEPRYAKGKMEEMYESRKGVLGRG
jgi:endoglucanase